MLPARFCLVEQLRCGTVNYRAMKIKTGKGTITLTVLLAIWSVSAIASLP